MQWDGGGQVCAWKCTGLQRPGRGVRSPGAVVTGGCEPHEALGTKLRPSSRAACTLPQLSHLSSTLLFVKILLLTTCVIKMNKNSKCRLRCQFMKPIERTDD